MQKNHVSNHYSVTSRLCMLRVFFRNFHNIELRFHRFTRIIIYLCVAVESVLLGFQHYLLVLGMTVLIPSIIVPQMGGDNVRINLFSKRLLLIYD